MLIGEVAEDVFAVFINTVQEEVLQLGLVLARTGLLVAHSLYFVLLLIHLALHPHQLLFLVLVVGAEEGHDFLKLSLWLEVLCAECLDARPNVRHS